jgi:uncharacterized alkaline shock family protein YloU
MAKTKYIKTAQAEKTGGGFIAGKAFAQMAFAALEEMPNVATDPKAKINKESGINIRLVKEITCWIDQGMPTLFIHVEMRKDENASSLAKGLQQEISEQILSLTEIPACQVNVKIDGIF